MKRLMTAALMVGLMGLAGTRLARAHGDDGKKGEVSEKMKERMKEKLGLTDEQADGLEDAMKAHHEAMKPLHRKLRDSMRKLEDQVEDGASDKDVAATLSAMDDARKALDAEREKLEAVFAKTLKPTQRAKMRLALGHRMMRGGMHGGPRGGGWGHERPEAPNGGDEDDD